MFGKILISLMFGGVGAWLAYHGVAAFINARRFVSGASTTRGTVAAHEAEISESTDDQGRRETTTFYYPIVEFTDAEGIQRRVRTSTGRSPKSFSEGAAVTVLYSRDDSARAEIKSFGQLWFMPAALTGSGTVFLMITVGVWVFNVPVSTPFDILDSRPPVPAVALPPLSETKISVHLGPIVIAEAEPNPARIGAPITLRGSNFGRPEDHRVSVGGHGLKIDLEVIKWERGSVTVRIPNDPRIVSDRSYYYRIERGEFPVESSNLFMFRFETNK